jgi:hypothetical protein
MTLSIKLRAAKVATVFMITTSVSALAADSTVNVLYAGSLVNLMERSAGPDRRRSFPELFPQLLAKPQVWVNHCPTPGYRCLRYFVLIYQTAGFRQARSV